MNGLISLHHRVFAGLERTAPGVLPSLARLVFAGVLMVYFWASALTKTGEGLFGVLQPSLGAYAQIFPRQMEAAGYDVSHLAGYLNQD